MNLLFTSCLHYVGYNERIREHAELSQWTSAELFWFCLILNTSDWPLQCPTLLNVIHTFDTPQSVNSNMQGSVWKPSQTGH